jgi:guanylate kinase
VGPEAPARLTVLAGPSGVGKGTVAALLVERYPQVYLSVSTTTRSPRPGEIDGVNYFFVDSARFDELVAEGRLLEWATYGGNRYGTPRGAVETALAQGRPALLEIDLAGARQVRESAPEARQVFLAPPSFDELVRRLTERGTETPEQRHRRLVTAKAELAAQGEFDVVLVNKDLDRTVSELAGIMGLH